jgi:hypothetical protein
MHLAIVVLELAESIAYHAGAANLHRLGALDKLHNVHTWPVGVWAQQSSMSKHLSVQRGVRVPKALALALAKGPLAVGLTGIFAGLWHREFLSE